MEVVPKGHFKNNKTLYQVKNKTLAKTYLQNDILFKFE